MQAARKLLLLHAAAGGLIAPSKWGTWQWPTATLRGTGQQYADHFQGHSSHQFLAVSGAPPRREPVILPWLCTKASRPSSELDNQLPRPGCCMLAMHIAVLPVCARSVPPALQRQTMTHQPVKLSTSHDQSIQIRSGATLHWHSCSLWLPGLVHPGVPNPPESKAWPNVDPTKV